jgi:DNA polymerase-3 subunit epsilon
MATAEPGGQLSELPRELDEADLWHAYDGEESMNLATILQLQRPLSVVDTETTGTNPETDRICQIAITIHYPLATDGGSSRDPIAWSSLVNPGIPIPAETTAIHHITDEMVRTARPFRDMAPKLSKSLTNIDFCGFNVPFDLKMIAAEMKRAGASWSYESASIIDAHRIYRILHPRNLSAAYSEFVGAEPPSDAHDAGIDVRMTEEVLAGQLNLHPEIPRDIKALHDYCWPKAADAVDGQRKFKWVNGEACIAFGKFNGAPLRTMEKGYLKWMMNGDFAADTKRIVEDALSGAYPSPPSRLTTNG